MSWRKKVEHTPTRQKAVMYVFDGESANLDWISELLDTLLLTFRKQYAESPVDFEALNLTYDLYQELRPFIRGQASDILRGELEDGTELAIKVQRLQTAGSTGRKRLYQSLQLVKTFLREVTVLHELDHINIAKLLGFTLTPTGLGLVSVWQYNGDLAQYLKSKPDASKPDLLLDVAEGVHYLQTRFYPLIHGDLKGTNVLVNENGIACITDFGNSRRIDDVAWGKYFRAEGGGGALAWMAPEMLVGTGEPTLASDIYAYAGVLLEIYCPGKWPYHYIPRKSNITRTKLKGEHPDRVHYPEMQDEDDLWNLIVRCWDRDSSKRPVIQELIQLFYDMFRLAPRTKSTAHRPSIDGMDEYSTTPEDSGVVSLIYEDRSLNEAERLTQLFEKCILLHKNSYPDSPVDFTTLDLTGVVCRGRNKLGFGRFADVFNGSMENGTQVAIKVLRLPTYRDDQDDTYESAILRFVRELNSWNGLLHMNVVKMLGYTMENDDIALVAPLYSNGSLVDYLQTYFQSSRPDLMLDVTEGLAYLHQAPNQLIHSDLKGSNVLVDEHGIAYLTDFGISRRIADLSRTTGFTTNNAAQGTTQWMSPELLDDGPNSLAADIYACAGVLLEICCPGKWPYHYIRNEHLIVIAKIDGELLDRSEYPEMDDLEDLWRLMCRCWSVNPDKRPTIQEVVRMLYDMFMLKPREAQSTTYRLPLYESQPSTSGSAWKFRSSSAVEGPLIDVADDEANLPLEPPVAIQYWGRMNLTHLFKGCVRVPPRLRPGWGDGPVVKPKGINLTKRISHTECRLGYGCFSDVYQGRLDEGTEVGIKVLRLPTYVRHEDHDIYISTFMKFFREMKYWSDDVQANIVPFLGFTVGYNSIGLVSPLYPNGNVVQFLRSHPEANKSDLMLGVAEGVRYLHNTNPPFIHSDIKGSNILIDDNGTPRLGDFGISKYINNLDLTIGLATSGGSASKTPWMAPELFEGELVYTFASDIYACAAVFIEISCPGKWPYHYINGEAKVISAKRQGELPDRMQYPELSEHDALWDIALQCWNLDPTERPEIDHLTQALRKVLTPQPEVQSGGSLGWRLLTSFGRMFEPNSSD